MTAIAIAGPPISSSRDSGLPRTHNGYPAHGTVKTTLACTRSSRVNFHGSPATLASPLLVNTRPFVSSWVTDVMRCESGRDAPGGT